MSESSKSNTTRRNFLKTTGLATASASAMAWGATPRVHAAEDNTIQIALVGCGGRGTGAAANALATTSGPVKLVAMADVFENRLQSSLQGISNRFADKIDVPEDRQFVGFDGYKKAMDCLRPGVDLVLLTTPPAFRPVHLEHAVEKGVNVFMEKSFAVDAPGIRRVLAAGKKASEKNLKVAGGLMSRHSPALEAAVQQIHDGAIGEVISISAYRVHGPVPYSAKHEGESDLLHQIRNYHGFHWTNGSFILDWLIHNLDVSCWVKDDWPVSAQGQGGRQVRKQQDQLFDHYAAEYIFPDGKKLYAHGRHMVNCWGFFGDVVHGTKGSAVLGEGISNPKLYKGYRDVSEDVIWTFEGQNTNAYDREHELLFNAIRQDLPYNETERSAYAAMTGILGRMACDSGKEIRWDEAMASDLVIAPEVDEMDYDTPPPVQADEDGEYPVAMPGFATVL